MGGCLSPILANAFMCYYERKWLDECPTEYKTLFYRRYVDDTFLLFANPDHIPLFKQYLNSKHPNINFTSESEEDNKLPFIGVSVSHHNLGFLTNVYRKPTDTGLGMNFFSFTQSSFKNNSILTLLHRCFSICSNWLLFNEEVKYLHTFYSNNHFPSGLFWRAVKKFRRLKCNPPPVSTNVPKDRKYISLPFLGHHSYALRNNLQKLFRSYYPQINIRIILSNKSTIGSMFPVKDKLPLALRSNVIYEYKCEDCGSSYVGSTTRCLHERICEHMAVSFLTGNRVQPKASSIRAHCTKESHPIQRSSFRIIGQAQKYDNILLLESVFIKYLHPDLNDMMSSMPLHLT